MSGGDLLLVDRADGLVTLTFNRPDRKNGLIDGCWDQLSAALDEIARTPSDRAVLVTGAGDNFSSGADFGGKPEREIQPMVHEMRRAGDIVLRLQRLAKPTIAAVDGVAIGVALGIALACDLVVASDRARFSAVFSKRGLSLDGGTSWTLPRQVGLRRAKQIAFFGDMISASEALDWGLINEVVPADDLATVAGEWARRLATGPTTALSLTKRMLDASDTRTFEQAVEDEARCQHVVSTTHDLAEGFTAFFERRDPNFTGI